MTAFADTFDCPVAANRMRSSKTNPSKTNHRYLVSPRVIAAAVALAFLSVLATAVQADQPVVTVEYTVASGDTLWSIAASLTPPGTDVRETLVVVRELNGLDGSTIHPGQVLRLPTG